VDQLSERYLEDFAVGQTFGSGRLRIDGERALAFAAEFDPQPFHLDEVAARRSIFGGLTASGWHTTAVTMRLLIEGELHPAGGFVGVGLDECHLPGRCARATSCASSARCSRCDRRNRVRSRA
jgi:acyl dehydratase